MEADWANPLLVFVSFGVPAMTQLTPGDIQKMLVNPIYAGIPPFPAIVDEDVWVAAGTRAIGEMGAEAFLRLMLQTLRESMESVQ